MSGEIPDFESILENKNQSLIIPGLGRAFPELLIEAYNWDKPTRTLDLDYYTESKALQIVYGIPPVRNNEGSAMVRLDANNLPEAMTFIMPRVGRIPETINCTHCEIKRDESGAIIEINRLLEIKRERYEIFRNEMIFLLDSSETGLPGTFVVYQMEYHEKELEHGITTDHGNEYFHVVYFSETPREDLVAVVGSERAVWLPNNWRGDVKWPDRKDQMKLIPPIGESCLIKFEDFGIEIIRTDDRPQIIRRLELDQITAENDSRTRSILDSKTIAPEGYQVLAPSIVVPETSKLLEKAPRRLHALFGNFRLKRNFLEDGVFKVRMEAIYDVDMQIPYNILLKYADSKLQGRQAKADLFYAGDKLTGLICSYGSFRKESLDPGPTITETVFTDKISILDLGDYYLLITLSQNESSQSEKCEAGKFKSMEMISKPRSGEGKFVVSASLQSVTLIPDWRPEQHLRESDELLDSLLINGINTMYLANGEILEIYVNGLDVSLTPFVEPIFS